MVVVFLKPARGEDFLEIQFCPKGQWSSTHVKEPCGRTDFHWDSKLKVETMIHEAERVWRGYLGLPFQPMIEAALLPSPPQVGEVWRVNLCRVAGKEPEREYLAWRPTFSGEPNFHIPSAFGNLIFSAQRKNSR